MPSQEIDGAGIRVDDVELSAGDYLADVTGVDPGAQPEPADDRVGSDMGEHHAEASWWRGSIGPSARPEGPAAYLADEVGHVHLLAYGGVAPFLASLGPDSRRGAQELT